MLIEKHAYSMWQHKNKTMLHECKQDQTTQSAKVKDFKTQG